MRRPEVITLGCTSECDHSVGVHWSPEDVREALNEAEAPPRVLTQHGGARPNSGPKPIEPGGKDYAFRLFPSHIRILEALMQRTGLNRSAALRQIIEESTP